MTFQLVNNLKMTLAAEMSADATELIVLDLDLSGAEMYDPTKTLSLTLVGDEELNQYEIVYATERTGTTFTVSRGEEDTTAGTWTAGTMVIAALTAAAIRDLTQAPTTADNITYEGGNFGGASTVEEAIDDQGDAIVRLASDTEYYETVEQRIGGGLFSGGSINSTNLRWQGSAKRFTTAGFGVAVTPVATMDARTSTPDMSICIRYDETSRSNWGSVKLRIFNNAAPTNYIEWTVAPSATTSYSEWRVLHFLASAGTVGGTPGTNIPDRVQIEFIDDSTGQLIVDLNFVDVVKTRNSYLGAFVNVTVDAEFAKVNAIAQYGFKVSLVIKDTDLLTLDQTLLRKAQVDGHRIYLTSDSNFKAQTLNQALNTLYSALRSAFAVYVKPDGWIYKNRYNGPFDADANRSVRGAVSTVFPRGVGIETFRSAVEVYRFDDPLYTTTNLADATTKLASADETAINIDLSVLSVADLNTLMAAVIASDNFYQISDDNQNADNITSGTLDIERLPMATIQEYVCPVGTVLPFGGIVIPAGWVLCDGRLLTRTSYPALFSSVSTTYGSTSGTNFRVPDLRGFVVAGRDNMGTGAAGRLTNVPATLGATGGAQNHTLLTAEMPSHNHTGFTDYTLEDHTHVVNINSGTVSSDHTHSFSGTTDGGGQSVTALSNVDINPPGTAGARFVGGTHTHTFSGATGGISANHYHNVYGSTGGASLNHRHGIPFTGSNTAHNNTQLTMVLNWIIRAI